MMIAPPTANTPCLIPIPNEVQAPHYADIPTYLEILQQIEAQQERLQADYDDHLAGLLQTFSTKTDAERTAITTRLRHFPKPRTWARWNRYYHFLMAHAPNENAPVTEQTFNQYWKQYADKAFLKQLSRNRSATNIAAQYVQEVYRSIAAQIQQGIPPGHSSDTLDPPARKLRRGANPQQRHALQEIHSLVHDMQAQLHLLVGLIGKPRSSYAPDLLAECAASVLKAQKRLAHIAKQL